MPCLSTNKRKERDLIKLSEKEEFYALKLLDTNLPLKLPGLSTNLPYALRFYRVFRGFRGEKVKKVCDNNLTCAGYGAICVENSLPM